MGNRSHAEEEGASREVRKLRSVEHGFEKPRIIETEEERRVVVVEAAMKGINCSRNNLLMKPQECILTYSTPYKAAFASV